MADKPKQAGPQERPTSKPRHKQKRRKKPPASPEVKAARILADMRGLLRDLGAELGAPRGGGFVVDEVDLRLSIPMRGGNDKAAAASASALVTQLRERVAEVVRGVTSFAEGHVYCFFTDASESAYSSPPTPNDVFAGYTSNGKPSWVSLANLCLERGVVDVDRLYGPRAQVVALMQRADELSEGLLPYFGRGSLAYELLGQVVVGFVPLTLNPKDQSAERVALTLQVARTTLRTGSHRLRLNVLGMTPLEIAVAAAEGHERGPGEAFRRVLQTTRQRLDVLGRKARQAQRDGAPLDMPREVDALLTRLRADCVRVFKARSHRTQHARVRAEEGDRPTSYALTDADAAAETKLFIDTHRDTIVVLGPRSRAHAFNKAGKHVTSWLLDPGEADRKTDKRRWRQLQPEHVSEFRKRLAERGG